MVGWLAGEWRGESDWPPPGAGEVALHLGADGMLGESAGTMGADAFEYVVPCALRFAMLGHRCAAMHFVTSEACRPSTLISSTWLAGGELESAPATAVAPAVTDTTVRATSAERGSRCFMGPPLVRAAVPATNGEEQARTSTPRSALPSRV